LAWLSQQGFGTGLQQDSRRPNSDVDSDKENRQIATSSTTSTATSVATGLPTLSMDIAGRLQKAFWAANFSRDNPYGSWMNPAANHGFATVAAAAAAAAAAANVANASSMGLTIASTSR
jgi:hypothetical protein